jgi:hypothetical protein
MLLNNALLSAGTVLLQVSVGMVILNAALLVVASQREFDLIHFGGYWRFHRLMLCVAVVMALAAVALLCVTCETRAAAARVSKAAAACTTVLLAAAVTAYVGMARLWSADPEHTLLVYAPFWTESAVPPLPGPSRTRRNQTSGRVDEPAPEWVYEMYDVVARVYGFLLVVLPFAFAAAALRARRKRRPARSAANQYERPDGPSEPRNPGLNEVAQA